MITCNYLPNILTQQQASPTCLSPIFYFGVYASPASTFVLSSKDCINVFHLPPPYPMMVSHSSVETPYFANNSHAAVVRSPQLKRSPITNLAPSPFLSLQLPSFSSPRSRLSRRSGRLETGANSSSLTPKLASRVRRKYSSEGGLKPSTAFKTERVKMS
jgi:hypothetical protein